MGFFLSITLNISCHSLLGCEVYPEKSAASLMHVPLNIFSCFSIVVFKILSVSLIFFILIIMHFGVVLSGLILFETLCFLNLAVSFLSQIK